MGLLSFEERDRRWHLVRREMEKRGLPCLLVSALGKDFAANFSEWLVDDSGVEFVIFPLNKEPTVLYLLTQFRYREVTGPWVEDYKAGPILSEAIVSRLRELGIESGKVGVIGVAPAGMSTEGNVPYTTWSRVIQALPKVEFEDATWWFAQIALVKSPEEMRFVEKAADIIERADAAFLAAVKPGIGEDDLYRIFHNSVTEQRGYVQLFLMGSGPTALAQSVPEWLSSGIPPRILRAGDIVTTEMDVKYARYHAQAQLCVALNPVDRLHEECFRIANESIENALRSLRPGNKFGEVAEAVEAPLKEARAWHPGPLLHSMNPQILRTPHSMDYSRGSPREETGGTKSTEYFTWVRGSDITIQKNMIFEVEPVVCLEDHRVLVGGTVVVGDTGATQLNHIAFEMQRI